MAEKGENGVLSFEDALERLGKLVEQLESGKLTLSESLEVYEKAIGLSKRCTELLETAEQKVSLLRITPGGEDDEVPFALED